jgi:RimJ/RimL family protein N-acetyltransferase
VLKAESVALDSFVEDDRSKLYSWINSPELVRLSAPFRPVHAPTHADWFAELARDRSRVAFAIRTLPRRRLIGVVQLVGIDPIHRCAEMIIRIGERAEQGKGRGSEALRLLLDYAWRDLNLHRVEARAFDTNKRAIATYKKVGFAIEGKLREAAFIDCAWTDIIVLGILNPSQR